MSAPKRTEAPARTLINHPRPTVDGGRYAPKRCVGDTVKVSADIFRDGHEIMRAVVRYKAPGGRRWLEAPMHAVDAHVNGIARDVGEAPRIGQHDVGVAQASVSGEVRGRLERRCFREVSRGRTADDLCPAETTRDQTLGSEVADSGLTRRPAVV